MELGEAVTQAVLADPGAAPIDDRLRATLGFLKKLTLYPDHVGPADVEAVRQAGVSDQAISEAIHICALFNIIDRIADSLQFRIPSQEAFAQGAKLLLKRGYKL